MRYYNIIDKHTGSIINDEPYEGKSLILLENLVGLNDGCFEIHKIKPYIIVEI